MAKILIFVSIFLFFNVSANSNKHVHNSYDLLLALTDIKNGESIILESGVYVGNFVINKSIVPLCLRGLEIPAVAFGCFHV